MGWAVTYRVKFGRPLSPPETAAFTEWTRAHFSLDGVGPHAVAVVDKYGIKRGPLPGSSGWLEEWRGLLSPEQIAQHRAQFDAVYARAGARDDADYAGFIQTRSNAAYCKVVRAFQSLEERLPFAEIRLSDDHYLRDQRPRDAGDPARLVRR